MERHGRIAETGAISTSCAPPKHRSLLSVDIFEAATMYDILNP